MNPDSEQRRARRLRLLKRLATPVVLLAAVLYFVIDAVFATALRPFIRWLGRLAVLERLGAWVRSLGPYPTLALFLVPVVLLEPVKPLGLYLLGTGHPVEGILVLGLGETLKIVLVERLFHMSRDKLMQIRLFARAHGFVVGWLDRLKALPPWRMVAAAARRVGAVVAALRLKARR